jgi:hypothetical protein
VGEDSGREETAQVPPAFSLPPKERRPTCMTPTNSRRSTRIRTDFSAAESRTESRRSAYSSQADPVPVVKAAPPLNQRQASGSAAECQRARFDLGGGVHLDPAQAGRGIGGDGDSGGVAPRVSGYGIAPGLRTNRSSGLWRNPAMSSDSTPSRCHRRAGLVLFLFRARDPRTGPWCKCAPDRCPHFSRPCCVGCRALQIDGGEFAAEFDNVCQQRGFPLFLLPPRSAKLNGHVERAQRTHTVEFH